MKYFRVHTADIAYVTKQPRGIFTAVGKLRRQIGGCFITGLES